MADPDFFSSGQPLSQSGRRKIILSRVNEPLTRIDDRRFQMLNGSWPATTTLEVYDLSSDINGTLVPSNLYTTDPQSGLITFLSSQLVLSRYSGTVITPALFRLVCKITNYSDKPSDAVALRNIGVSWNLTQRTTNTHAPLGDRLLSSSSSSSFSSSSISISQVNYR